MAISLPASGRGDAESKLVAQRRLGRRSGRALLGEGLGIGAAAPGEQHAAPDAPFPDAQYPCRAAAVLDDVGKDDRQPSPLMVALSPTPRVNSSPTALIAAHQPQPAGSTAAATKSRAIIFSSS